MNEPVEIRFVVNGKSIRDRVDGSGSLLNYLRDTLRLTGAKVGCGKAQCGACTVLVNDRPVKSCSLKLGSAGLAGARIETIEGLAAEGGGLHPVQEAFVRAGALQCGYCTPGMIMTAKGLLTANPAPTRQDIRKYLAPRNLCRCTGYQKIVDAVQDAGRVMRGKPARLAKAVNDAPLRQQEAVPKVTGRLR
jgi:carbon-monoxide dehydrogenase small subunit